MIAMLGARLGGVRPWTDKEIEIAAEMYARRADRAAAGIKVTRAHLLQAIAARLRRSIYSVESRLAQLGPTFRRTSSTPHRRRYNTDSHQVGIRACVPDDVLADRDRRALLEHDTLTAAFCGDPLPGYSARERG